MCISRQRTFLQYTHVGTKSDSIPVISFLKYNIPTLSLFLATRLGKLSSMTSQRRIISTLMMVTSLNDYRLTEQWIITEKLVLVCRSQEF